MRSAAVTMFIPWRLQNFARSSTRAIVPSSFMTSQITPAGISPARRARSTAASVWPTRSSTPPGLAGYGLSVADQIPIQHVPNPHNEAYLRAKRDRLGHTLHHQGLALDEEMLHGEHEHDRRRRQSQPE